MTAPSLLTRRDAVKRAAVSVLALPFLNALPNLSAAESSDAAGPPRDRVHGLKLGVATISLRDQPVASVVAILRQLEIGYVSIFRTHAPFETGTPEECRAAAEQFRRAGITVATSSVVYLTNNETAVRKAFENARAAGLTLMTCSPAPDALPLVERFVKEYGIRLAIHNHGPEDKFYRSPYEVLKLIEPYDSRIGLCLDVGHAMRARVNPAEAIRRCAARLYDVHLKDSRSTPGAMDDIPVEVGRGRMDIRAILAALIEIKYSGVAAFEYERLGVNPAIGLGESVGYVRGMLAAM